MKTDLSDRIIIILSLLVIITVPFFAIYNNWWKLGLFWDLDIYQRAARDGLAGLDAYREVDGMAFVYHPVFLHLFSAIQRLTSLQTVLGVAYILIILWVLYEIRASLKQIPGMEYSDIAHLYSPVLISITFFAIGVTTIATGNMTAYFHFALMAFLLHSLRTSGRYTTFGTMVLIGVLTAVKPYFLAYILLALLDNDSLRAKLGRMAVAVAVFVLIWASGLWIYPDEMQRFLHNIAGLQSDGRVDIGIGFYRIAYEAGLAKLPAFGVHLAVSGLLLIWVWRSIRDKRQDAGTQGFALALSYFALTLANPRIKEYDLWPALMFLFVFWNAVSPSAKKALLVFAVIFTVPILLTLVTFFMGIPPGYDPTHGQP